MAAMSNARFYRIVSKMGTGYVMGLAGNFSASDVPVQTQVPLSLDNEEQIWYEDHQTGTVRCKINHHCLDLDDNGTLVVNEYDPDRPSQQWSLSGETVRSVNDDRVVDVADHNEDPDAKLLAWDYKGNDNQQWSFEYVPDRFFIIKSHMNEKVLDISGWEDGDDVPAGSKVIMYDQKDEENDNQLWYEDDRGIVRSKIGALALDGSDESCIRVNEYEENNSDHQWVIRGKTVVLRDNPSQCLDIARKWPFNKAKLCAFEYRGKSNQEWDFKSLPEKFFFIKSHMNGKVLDIGGWEDGDDEPAGSKVIMYDQKDEENDNQLWYEDHRGIIRSKIGGLALDATDESRIRVNEYQENNSAHQWVIRGVTVVLRDNPTQCLDIVGRWGFNKAKLCAHEYNEQSNQEWDFETASGDS